MFPPAGPLVLLCAAVAALADEGPEAWVRRVEARIGAWRGAPVAPPLVVEAVAAEHVVGASGREPPRGFLARPAVVEAFGLDSFLGPSDVPGPRRDRAAAADGDRVLVATGASVLRRRLDLVDAVVRAVVTRRAAASDGAAPDDDAALARAALVEGEVRWLRSLVVADLATAIAERLDETDDLTVAEPTPPPLVSAWGRLLAEDGEAFLRAVHADGGWEAVDRASLAPPGSTEQLLHPRRAYLEARDEPVTVPASSLGARLPTGFETEASTTLGEFGVGAFVRLAGDPVRAVRVARGWDGDRATVWRRGDVRVLEWEVVFDDEADAAEAIDALRKVFQRRFHRTVAGDGISIVMDVGETAVRAIDEAGAVRSSARREGRSVRWVDERSGRLDLRAVVD